MFNIKKATITDIPLIRQLTFKVWPQTYASILSVQQIEYMLEMMYSESALETQMIEEGCSFIIVYEDGNPVGFASYSETEKSVWKLHKIYVLPNQQGKGTGRFMLDFITKEIIDNKGKSLQLQVNRYNRAKDFYEKLGFNVIQEADFDIGNGFYMNDYVMEKRFEV